MTFFLLALDKEDLCEEGRLEKPLQQE